MTLTSPSVGLFKCPTCKVMVCPDDRGLCPKCSSAPPKLIPVPPGSPMQKMGLMSSGPGFRWRRSYTILILLGLSALGGSVMFKKSARPLSSAKLPDERGVLTDLVVAPLPAQAVRHSPTMLQMEIMLPPAWIHLRQEDKVQKYSGFSLASAIYLEGQSPQTWLSVLTLVHLDAGAYAKDYQDEKAFDAFVSRRAIDFATGFARTHDAQIRSCSRVQLAGRSMRECVGSFSAHDRNGPLVLHGWMSGSQMYFSILMRQGAEKDGLDLSRSIAATMKPAAG